MHVYAQITYIHIYIYIYIHTYIHSHTYVYKYILSYVYKYIYIYIYTYIYTHNYIHIYTYLYLYLYLWLTLYRHVFRSATPWATLHAPFPRLTLSTCRAPLTLHVEYAERGKEYDILLMFSLFCEYINLEYVRVPVIYKVNQVEYVIHIRVAASQAYVNTYSARRPFTQLHLSSLQVGDALGDAARTVPAFLGGMRAQVEASLIHSRASALHTGLNRDFSGGMRAQVVHSGASALHIGAAALHTGAAALHSGAAALHSACESSSLTGHPIGGAAPEVRFGRYTILPLPILYGVWHRIGGGGGGSCIAHSSCNSYVIVWAMQVEGAILG